jgi:tRNA(Ile2) C34 agmatinyltransferase TiaS
MAKLERCSECGHELLPLVRCSYLVSEDGPRCDKPAIGRNLIWAGRNHLHCPACKQHLNEQVSR